MLKPLTLSLSLAVALGLCSVSKAGLHDSGCTTCGLASPQGVVASPQGTYAGGCGEAPCKPKHQFGAGLKNLFHHEVTYEWVLKKKHVWHRGGGSSCSTCGTAGAPVYATGQGGVAPSGQYAAPSGQYAAPQVYGAGQKSAFLPARSTTSIASVPAEMTPAALRWRGSPARPRSPGDDRRPERPPAALGQLRSLRIGLCRADHRPKPAQPHRRGGGVAPAGRDNTALSPDPSETMIPKLQRSGRIAITTTTALASPSGGRGPWSFLSFAITVPGLTARRRSSPATPTRCGFRRSRPG